MDDSKINALAKQLDAAKPPSDYKILTDLDESIGTLMGAKDQEQFAADELVKFVRSLVKLVFDTIFDIDGALGKGADKATDSEVAKTTLLETIKGISLCHPFLGALTGKTINSAAVDKNLPAQSWKSAITDQGCDTIGVRETTPDGNPLSCVHRNIE